MGLFVARLVGIAVILGLGALFFYSGPLAPLIEEGRVVTLTILCIGYGSMSLGFFYLEFKRFQQGVDSIKDVKF